MKDDYIETYTDSLILDINFSKDDKTYHLVKRDIEYDDCYCFPTVDVEHPLDNVEIAKIIVDYLAKIQMYLHDYSVVNEKTYVSYDLANPGFSDKLKYSPRFLSREVFVKINAQLEDEAEDDSLKQAGLIVISDQELKKNPTKLMSAWWSVPKV